MRSLCHLASLKSCRGFTLLELVISITMIAIIVSILGGVMRLGYRSMESGEKKIEHLERIRASLTVIESQVQSSFPFPYVEEGEGELTYYFTGERQLMQFPTHYSLWGGDTGYVIATYAVDTDQDGRQSLHVTENIIGTEESYETKLSEAFDSIYFEYFFQDLTEETGEWKEEWTDTTNTPSKVRLHFIQETGDIVYTVQMRVQGTPDTLDDLNFFRDEDDE
jgi:prepilin-type N-terminal cleavage/methylation domain-containing protein